MTTVNDVLAFAKDHPVHPEMGTTWRMQSPRFFAWATRLIDPEIGITSPRMPLDAIDGARMSHPIDPDAMPIPGDFLWWGNIPHGDVAMMLDDWKVLWLNHNGEPQIIDADALSQAHAGPYLGVTETFCGIRIEEH